MTNWDERHKSKEGPLYGQVPSDVISYSLAYLKHGNVLDLGCGDGRNAIYLAQRGFNVIGVDSSKVALEKFLRFASEKKVESRNYSIHRIYLKWHKSIVYF